jgi:hypothetical protein
MPDLFDLQGLIAEAVALGGGNLCVVEHDWASEGGRTCPRAGTENACLNGSQTVYRCRRCGTWDYGAPGGPGHADCADRPCSFLTFDDRDIPEDTEA